jgi:murein DD-endopeptidase MepM/ murein hydrolase activator NlpD
MAMLMRANAGYLLLILLLGGCGYAEWPPRGEGPTDVNAGARSGKANTQDSKAFRGATAVYVGKGDTVWALSKRHGVSMRAIIDANELTPPFLLRVGQRIVLPREREHQVVKGDTLSQLAANYDASLYELARLNKLEPPYTIYVGQRLRLPRTGGAPAVETVAVSSAKTAPAPKSEPAPAPSKPPAWATPPVKAVSAPAPVASRPATRMAVPKPPPTSGKGFLWPVQGRVISSFGAKPKGFHNDGINIAAPRGFPINAAQSGVVVYAGNELRGFGNLLLIKHEGGWVTAYAHADTLLVRRGDTVRKGQKVGTVGATGSVTTPQLHFEIRKGKRAHDPKKYLRRA